MNGYRMALIRRACPNAQIRGRSDGRKVLAGLDR
jgi:hypothetical protein